MTASSENLSYTINIAQVEKFVNTSIRFLKTYGELNQSALQHHQDKLLFSLYLFKELNTTKSGLIKFSKALHGLMNQTNLTKSPAYQILKNGEGLFWKIIFIKGVKFLKLASYQSIAQHYHIKFLGRPTIIDLNECEHYVEVKAWLYASQFKNENYEKLIHPLSRGQLQILNCVSPSTQRKYDKIAGTKIIQNFSADEYVEYVGKSKTYHCQRQFGNSYITKSGKGNKGRTSKINKNLGKFHNQLCKLGETSDMKWPQRFFRSANSFIKCPNKENETFIISESLNDKNYWRKIS